MNSPTATASPMNRHGGVAPVPIAKAPKLGELRDYLSQLSSCSVSSKITKVAYRGYKLGVSQGETVALLTDHFSHLGYDPHFLRIGRSVEIARKIAKRRDWGNS